MCVASSVTTKVHIAVYLLYSQFSHFYSRAKHGLIQRGGGGGQRVGTPTPEKSQNNVGFLSNTGPYPLKIAKLPSHHRHASETPFVNSNLTCMLYVLSFADFLK